MKKKRIIPTAICLVVIAAILVIILLLPKHKVNYKTAKKNTSQTEMEQTIGSRPDETREENGMTINTYYNSIYMDYTGNMDYYYLDNKLVMSRWEMECDDREYMREAYQAICKNVAKDMGDGKTDTKQQCTLWNEEEKDVTVGCNVSGDKEYTIYIIENQL